MFYNTNLAEFNFFIVYLILLFLTKSCIVPKSEKRAFWKGKFQKIEAEEDLKEDGVIKWQRFLAAGLTTAMDWDLYRESIKKATFLK